ncbi:MAG: esterase [Acetobacteraceae bacterium]|nr:esterase [Acetobacteraceae bacterium]
MRPASAQAPAPAGAAPIQVASIGGLHFGGEVRTLSGLPVREVQTAAGGPIRRLDVNGDFLVGQMYAQYVKLANPRARHPLMLWHGGGLSGTCWEDTPDGRTGWQSFFLRQGHDTWVSDAFERGRASWPRFPEFIQEEPLFRTLREAWLTFRFGAEDGWALDPARRRPFPGQRFPVDAIENLGRQAIPRWTTTNPQIQAAYDAYLQRVGPAVIIVHSQGCNFAFQAAINAPDRVAAIVAVEASGAPDPARAEVARARGIPILYVWGDYMDQGPWPAFRRTVDRFMEAHRAAGGRGDVLDLPARGIRGNSHMIMHDDNSDEVAALIQAWLGERGLMRG